MQLFNDFALANGFGKVLSWNYFASVQAGSAQELDTFHDVELKKVRLKVGNVEKLYVIM